MLACRHISIFKNVTYVWSWGQGYAKQYLVSLAITWKPHHMYHICSPDSENVALTVHVIKNKA